MNTRAKNIIIILLILIAGFIYYQLTEPVKQHVLVSRAIDGDTFKSETETFRLIGINTPEKRMPYYEEAKLFLRRYENQIISIELAGEDKYKRNLVYAFSNSLINEEILRNGLGNLYVYEKDHYTTDLEEAEEFARVNELGIWKKSSNYGCIQIINFSPIDLENESESLILQNSCSPFDIIIKDEANHIFREVIHKNLTLHFKDTFNDEGDALHIWDESGLILYYKY